MKSVISTEGNFCTVEQSSDDGLSGFCFMFHTDVDGMAVLDRCQLTPA